MGRRCGEFDGPGARSSGSGVDWIYGNAGLALVAALLCHLANSGTKRNRCIPCHGKAQIGWMPFGAAMICSTALV